MDLDALIPVVGVWSLHYTQSYAKEDESLFGGQRSEDFMRRGRRRKKRSGGRAGAQNFDSFYPCN